MSVEGNTVVEESPNGQVPSSSLGTRAARNLATTTKTPPQTAAITNRWVQRILPWVEVKGGTYRVNRRLSYRLGDGRIELIQTGQDVRPAPAELAELEVLRGFTDQGVLQALADRFSQRTAPAGSVLAEAGSPVSEVLIIAHGRAVKHGTGRYDANTRLGVIADGEFLGGRCLADPEATWEFTATAETDCVLLGLARSEFQQVLDQSEGLRAQLESYRATAGKARNRQREAAIEVAAGHQGEPVLASTFADYETQPREYELQVAQTVMRVHSRVADLYNEPMNQVEHQLKLTITELRERQEYELINNPEFGLLANTDFSQRISPREGPPTPDDLDELLCRRRDSKFFLAHPRAIAAFGRECNKRGLYPASVPMGEEHTAPAWRGVPVLPCPVIPIDEDNTSSILVLRTGEDNQGVVGLHQTGIPDEYEPGLNVRFMGIDEKAVISYLVSAYFSAAVLVPDAIGMLEHVDLGG